jgi:hypothetical protein
MGSGCCTARCSERVVEIHKSLTDLSPDITFIPLRRKSKAELRMLKRQKFMDQYCRRKTQSVHPETPKSTNNNQEISQKTQ